MAQMVRFFSDAGVVNFEIVRPKQDVEQFEEFVEQVVKCIEQTRKTPKD